MRRDQTPHGDIDRFYDFVGIDRARFAGIADSLGYSSIAEGRADGAWFIRGLLIDDWELA